MKNLTFFNEKRKVWPRTSGPLSPVTRGEGWGEGPNDELRDRPQLTFSPCPLPCCVQGGRDQSPHRGGVVSWGISKPCISAIVSPDVEQRVNQGRCSR